MGVNRGLKSFGGLFIGVTGILTNLKRNLTRGLASWSGLLAPGGPITHKGSQ